MINIILILVLFQSPTTPQDCPTGTVKSGGMATSGCSYSIGCYTPEQKKENDEWFARCWCGEMGHSLGSEDFDDSYSSTWVDHHCVSKQTYRRHLFGKWIEITKDQYYWYTCSRVTSYDGVSSTIVYPKSEWTHCKDLKRWNKILQQTKQSY